jgi:5-methyltetrahydrofolate--homocysteine methyltransferase
MKSIKITDTIKNGRVLVSDGAWGTVLHERGLKPGECPELWSVSKHSLVEDIAMSYIKAGADMVQTNSFGANRCKLGYFDLQNRTVEINEAAAAASRKAAGDDHWVIASVGPTGKMLITEEISPEELYSVFKEQVEALEKGGADAICIETMSDSEEAVLAIKAAKENTNCETICTFTFEKTLNGDYRTMMGETVKNAVTAAIKAGADIIGANCGNGFEGMIEIVREIRTFEKIKPVLIHANAGMPKNIDGRVVFPETPEMMAKRTEALITAGANIIGGCCGTTPEHIKAIKSAVGLYMTKTP